MLKILQINKFFYESGGVERHLFELSKLLELKGYKVIPFSMKHPKNKKTPYERYFVKQKDFSVVNLKNLKNIFGFFYSFEAKRKLEELVKVEKPDVAHLHNISHYITPAIFKTLKKYQLPIIMTVHDLQFACPNATGYDRNNPCLKCLRGNFLHCLKKRCVKRSFFASLICAIEALGNRIFKVYQKNVDLFIAPSAFLKEKLVIAGFRSDKILVIKNFIYVQTDNDIDQTNASGQYFVYLGRIEKEKGLLILIRAFENYPAELVIVGDGSLKNQIQEIIKQKNLSNIKLAGYLNFEKTQEIIKKSIAVIVPSECYENAPMAILESFKLGKPVIAANIGGIPEIVKHNQNGLLFEPGNVKQLKDAVLRLQNNPNFVKILKLRGYNLVKKYYNQERYFNQIKEAYERIKKP